MSLLPLPPAAATSAHDVGVPAADVGVSAALGSRRWFRQLDQSTATEFVLTLPWRKGRSSSSYSKYLRPHAKSLAGVPAIEIVGRAKADFCFDFA